MNRTGTAGSGGCVMYANQQGASRKPWVGQNACYGSGFNVVFVKALRQKSLLCLIHLAERENETQATTLGHRLKSENMSVRDAAELRNTHLQGMYITSHAMCR